MTAAYPNSLQKERLDPVFFKNRHILGGGSQSKAKFATQNIDEVRGIVREALRSPNAQFIPNPALGSNTFRVISELGRPIGIKGQTSVRVIVGLDGKVINTNLH